MNNKNQTTPSTPPNPQQEELKKLFPPEKIAALKGFLKKKQEHDRLAISGKMEDIPALLLSKKEVARRQKGLTKKWGEEAIKLKRPPGQPKSLLYSNGYELLQPNQNELYLIDTKPAAKGTYGVVNQAWQVIDHSNLHKHGLLEDEEPTFEFLPVVAKEIIDLRHAKAFINNEIQAIQSFLGDEAKHAISFMPNGDSYSLIRSHIIMRAIPGEQLITRTETEGDNRRLCAAINDMAVTDQLAVVIAILKEIKNMHQKGWVHCDIKGENIKITTNPLKVYILDFGSARELDQSQELNDPTAAGTPYYISPEREKGRITRSTDIYSIAYDLPLLLTKSDDSLRSHTKQDKQNNETNHTVILIKNAFIEKMRAELPEDRPSAEQALDFFRDYQKLFLPKEKQNIGFFSSAASSKPSFVETFIAKYDNLVPRSLKEHKK